MSKELSMREALAKEPKHTVRLPLDPLNPENKVKMVAINGYAYEIVRGKTVEVPESIYNLLIETENI